MSNNLKEKLAAYGMVLPAFLVVMLTVAYPIVSAVIQSFQDGTTGEFTLANYAYFGRGSEKQPVLYSLYSHRNGCDSHRGGISSGSLSAVCKIENFPRYWYALFAATLCSGYVRGVRYDYHYPGYWTD